MCVISLLSNLHDTSPRIFIRCDLSVRKYLVVIRMTKNRKKERNEFMFGRQPPRDTSMDYPKALYLNQK